MAMPIKPSAAAMKAAKEIAKIPWVDDETIGLYARLIDLAMVSAQATCHSGHTENHMMYLCPVCVGAGLDEFNAQITELQREVDHLKSDGRSASP